MNVIKGAVGLLLDGPAHRCVPPFVFGKCERKLTTVKMLILKGRS